MAVTFTYDDGSDGLGLTGSIRKVIATWTGDSSGNAAGSSRKIVGSIVKAITDPSDGPTANYDIVLTDGYGVNILGNCIDDLANRHTSTTEDVYFGVSNLAATDPAGDIAPIVCDAITVTISNSGVSKSGVLVLYVRV